MQQSASDKRLNAISGEFRREAMEQAYRRAQIKRELWQLRMIWGTAVASFVLFAPLEYWLSGGVGSAWSAPRALIIAIGCCTLALTWLSPQARCRDYYTSLALLLAMLAYAWLLSQRHGVQLTAGALPLLVVGSYCFSPGRFVLLAGSGVLGSVLAALLVCQLTSAGRVHWLEFSFLLPANLLAALALGQVNRARRVTYLQGQQLRREVARRRGAQRALQVLHQRNLSLLHNTLPAVVANRLAADPTRKLAQHHPQATVLFADIVGFSELCRRLSASQLVNLLNRLFSECDELALRYGVEKIKTIGDAYLAVAGVNQGREGCSDQALKFAIAQQQASASLGRQLGLVLRLRCGVHTGPVVAGVIGGQRFAFDIWGETVNIASRLQAAAEPGEILVSAAARRHCGAALRFGPSLRLALRGCGEISACKLRRPLSVPQLPGNHGGD